ncbi:hypothetical protein DFH27DRAFT_643561 [Peziza echinospora]|nr:hypothetical protein DFH27DRAFT_643561 [Peziza echinospora]
MASSKNYNYPLPGEWNDSSSNSTSSEDSWDDLYSDSTLKKRKNRARWSLKSAIAQHPRISGFSLFMAVMSAAFKLTSPWRHHPDVPETLPQALAEFFSIALVWLGKFAYLIFVICGLCALWHAEGARYVGNPAATIKELDISDGEAFWEAEAERIRLQVAEKAEALDMASQADELQQAREWSRQEFVLPALFRSAPPPPPPPATATGTATGRSQFNRRFGAYRGNGHAQNTPAPTGGAFGGLEQTASRVTNGLNGDGGHALGGNNTNTTKRPAQTPALRPILTMKGLGTIKVPKSAPVMGTNGWAAQKTPHGERLADRRAGTRSTPGAFKLPQSALRVPGTPRRPPQTPVRWADDIVGQLPGTNAANGTNRAGRTVSRPSVWGILEPRIPSPTGPPSPARIFPFPPPSPPLPPRDPAPIVQEAVQQLESRVHTDLRAVAEHIHLSLQRQQELHDRQAILEQTILEERNMVGDPMNLDPPLWNTPFGNYVAVGQPQGTQPPSMPWQGQDGTWYNSGPGVTEQYNTSGPPQNYQNYQNYQTRMSSQALNTPFSPFGPRPTWSLPFNSVWAAENTENPRVNPQKNPFLAPLYNNNTNGLGNIQRQDNNNNPYTSNQNQNAFHQNSGNNTAQNYQFYNNQGNTQHQQQQQAAPQQYVNPLNYRDPSNPASGAGFGHGVNNNYGQNVGGNPYEPPTQWANANNGTNNNPMATTATNNTGATTSAVSTLNGPAPVQQQNVDNTARPNTFANILSNHPFVTMGMGDGNKNLIDINGNNVKNNPNINDNSSSAAQNLNLATAGLSTPDIFPQPDILPRSSTRYSFSTPDIVAQSSTPYSFFTNLHNNGNNNNNNNTSTQPPPIPPKAMDSSNTSTNNSFNTAATSNDNNVNVDKAPAPAKGSSSVYPKQKQYQVIPRPTRDVYFQHHHHAQSDNNYTTATGRATAITSGTSATATNTYSNINGANNTNKNNNVIATTTTTPQAPAPAAGEKKQPKRLSPLLIQTTPLPATSKEEEEAKKKKKEEEERKKRITLEDAKYINDWLKRR